MCVHDADEQGAQLLLRAWGCGHSALSPLLQHTAYPRLRDSST